MNFTHSTNVEHLSTHHIVLGVEDVMAKAALVFVCLLRLQLKTQEINSFSVKEERRSKQGTPFKVLLKA